MYLLNLDNQWRFRKIPGPAPRLIFGNMAEIRARMPPIVYTMVRHAPATHVLPTASSFTHSLHPHKSPRCPGSCSLFRYSILLTTFLLVALLQWASKHGPIFRCFFLRQPVVVIQDIDLAHQVMVKHFKVGCTDSTV